MSSRQSDSDEEIDTHHRSKSAPACLVAHAFRRLQDLLTTTTNGNADVGRSVEAIHAFRNPRVSCGAAVMLFPCRTGVPVDRSTPVSLGSSSSQQSPPPQVSREEYEKVIAENMALRKRCSELEQHNKNLRDKQEALQSQLQLVTNANQLSVARYHDIEKEKEDILIELEEEKEKNEQLEEEISLLKSESYDQYQMINELKDLIDRSVSDAAIK